MQSRGWPLARRLNNNRRYPKPRLRTEPYPWNFSYSPSYSTSSYTSSNEQNSKKKTTKQSDTGECGYCSAMSPSPKAMTDSRGADGSRLFLEPFHCPDCSHISFRFYCFRSRRILHPIKHRADKATLIRALVRYLWGCVATLVDARKASFPISLCMTHPSVKAVWSIDE